MYNSHLNVACNMLKHRLCLTDIGKVTRAGIKPSMSRDDHFEIE